MQLSHNTLSVFLLAFCMTKGTCRMGGDMRLERARQDHAAMDGARQDHAAMDGGNDGSVEEQSAFLGEKYKGFEYGESDIPGLWVFLPLEGSYSCSEILVKYVMSCSEILVKYAMSSYVKGSHMLGRCMVIEVDSYSCIR